MPDTFIYLMLIQTKENYDFGFKIFNFPLIRFVINKANPNRKRLNLGFCLHSDLILTIHNRTQIKDVDLKFWR